MRLALASVALVVSLSASAQQRYWVKDGASEKEFNADRAQCSLQARAIYQPSRDQVMARMNQPTEVINGVAIRRSPGEGAAALAQLANINDMERRANEQCMVGKGWELK